MRSATCGGSMPHAEMGDDRAHGHGGTAWHDHVCGGMVDGYTRWCRARTKPAQATTKNTNHKCENACCNRSLPVWCLGCLTDGGHTGEALALYWPPTADRHRSSGRCTLHRQTGLHHTCIDATRRGMFQSEQTLGLERAPWPWKEAVDVFRPRVAPPVRQQRRRCRRQTCYHRPRRPGHRCAPRGW